VCGTTGLGAEGIARLAQLAEARGRGVLLAPNFAIGVLLMQRFARAAARWFPDVEIVELHHERKRDAPSGTALATAEQIAGATVERIAERNVVPRAPTTTAGAELGSRGLRHRGVPIHSIRLPGLLAHQEVLFGGPGQVLSIRHDTLDRGAFMPGVLLGIRRIGERQGLWRSLEPFLEPMPDG
jgi:4-hydroxy-tetrahydrodipicolinate reductase